MEYICFDCPRKCGVLRKPVEGSGYCSCPSLPLIARAAPHYGEEPCISGKSGSGTVFFSGCNLKCIFCQNHEISFSLSGKQVDKTKFREILFSLKEQGVNNINLVTGTPYITFIADALSDFDIGIPVVWNSSGYESVDALKMLDGLIQIYLPDMKYGLSGVGKKYSSVPDYPEIAAQAISEMYRQTGPVSFNAEGIMQKGVLIRHLIIPGELANSKAVIDRIASSFDNKEIWFSLLSQYTPVVENSDHKNLNRHLSKKEYNIILEYLTDSGIINGFSQEISSSGEEMIPLFDETGL